MVGKHILITGANSGLGKATALGLAKKGAAIHMLCRNQAKGQAALQEIIHSTGNTNVLLWICDLSLLQDVRKFCKKFKSEVGHLDVLINNAGATFPKMEMTSEGLEKTLVVNYLSHFLLTKELLPLLKKASPARVVTVTGYHHKGDIHFDDPNLENGYDFMKSIYQTTLAKVIFTKKLATDYPLNILTANCIHPGATRTQLQKNLKGLIRILAMMVRPFFASPEKNAKPIIKLASHSDVATVTGHYFMKDHIAVADPRTEDKEFQDKVWDWSEALVGQKSQR